jgi:hypothetical protein
LRDGLLGDCDESGRSPGSRAATTADDRERAYIDALTLLFGEDDARWADHAIAYETAMATLVARFPDDKEAVIFDALALNIAASPADENFQKQTKAAELLLIALSEQPRHPGLAHYLTYCLSLPTKHLADSPSLSAYRNASAAQSLFAVLALIGVGTFFFAVLPKWSRVHRI